MKDRQKDRQKMPALCCNLVAVWISPEKGQHFLPIFPTISVFPLHFCNPVPNQKRNVSDSYQLLLQAALKGFPHLSVKTLANTSKTTNNISVWRIFSFCSLEMLGSWAPGLNQPACLNMSSSDPNIGFYAQLAFFCINEAASPLCQFILCLVLAIWTMT